MGPISAKRSDRGNAAGLTVEPDPSSWPTSHPLGGSTSRSPANTPVAKASIADLAYDAALYGADSFLATSLTNPRQAVRMYRKRMQPEQYFKDGKQRFGLNRSTATTTDRLQTASGGRVGLLLASCLLILLGVRSSPTFRRQVCSRGNLGILRLGYEFYPATPGPPDDLVTTQRNQTGHA